MSLLEDADLAQFTKSVDGVLRKVWPSAIAAGSGTVTSDLAAVWDLAIEQGWTELAGDRALDAVVAAIAVTGRIACPLPLMDVYVSALLFDDHDNLRRSIETGTIRPVIAVGPDSLRFVEAAGAATHVIELLTTESAVRIAAITDVRFREGIAKPDWADVAVDTNSATTIGVAPEVLADALTLLRLGAATRALGAATRTFELSVEHACNRVAFGKTIGSFQAVSHRAANSATDSTAARLLGLEASRAWMEERADWRLSVELAVTFTADAAIRTQFDSAHTLAATGFFEEHEAAWLFRRVNADVARLDQLPAIGGDVSAMLVDQGRAMPWPTLSAEAESFRTELRALIASGDQEAVISAAIERGYVTLAWPESAGGRGASIDEEIVLAEEFKYARIPFVGKTAADLLGPTIIKYGTEEQKDRLLPILASGEFDFYLGYSEPEVGSDLANLRTRAVRDGDDWIVDGQKSWGTRAHNAEWVWLAVRTDPEASRPHAGITVFLTRTDRPGLELQHHRALSGDINSTTFLDGFRVPDADRVGEVNDGWRVITSALTKERVMMATIVADIHRLLDDLLAVVRESPERTIGAMGSRHRDALGMFAARLQAARVLMYAAARSVSIGGGTGAEASMAKIIATPLQEDFCVGAFRILGPAAGLASGATGSLGDGALDYHLRNSIKQVVGGGTIDIQRNLIARSLGLPR
ncbi:acyl-CoA dehydrogenase family protein [Nocardia jiangxiensis]|uniref:Acyl-CoA dehydrogenase family protein n=1 Tax=Nocardia jiangxiensis TaxID=282685 RepID=A0ABW6S7K4_9NOCA